MRKQFFALLAGIIVTCLTDPARNGYTDFQVDGGILYSAGKLYFMDVNGDKYEVSEQTCTITKGDEVPPGADMRADGLPSFNCGK